MSNSPLPPMHKALSDPPSCTKMCLKGGNAVDHEGSHVSLWLKGLWTLQGRLVVCTSSTVEVLTGNSPCQLYAVKNLISHDVRGSIVLLGQVGLNLSGLRVVAWGTW